jgi:hypothetical protein
MARTVTRRAALGAGLLTLAGVGGAGGYGAGLFLTDEPSLAGTAAPLPMGSVPSTTESPTAPPVKIVPDHTKALDVDDLDYTTRAFEASNTVRSAVHVRVPRTWKFTQPDPPTIGRYNDPSGKRWIRVEAGFTIRRPPEESMAARISQLKSVPARQMLTYKSQTVDPDTGEATLEYTFVPGERLQLVIIRWVANAQRLCTFEIAVVGLPQDRDALQDILQHAAESAVRDDTAI